MPIPKEPSPNHSDDNKDIKDDQTNHASNDPQSSTEVGGRKGPDPVRYGDWEVNGKCVDF